MNSPSFEAVWNNVENLLDARDRQTCAQIDAACCQTRTDIDRKYEYEHKFEALKGALFDILSSVMEQN